MTDDWRVYLVAVLFGLYLGVLGGTRRDEDRHPAGIALGLALLAGIATALFGSGTESAALAATSLIIGPPVAILTMYGVARRRLQA